MKGRDEGRARALALTSAHLITAVAGANDRHAARCRDERYFHRGIDSFSAEHHPLRGLIRTGVLDRHAGHAAFPAALTQQVVAKWTPAIFRADIEAKTAVDWQPRDRPCPHLRFVAGRFEQERETLPFLVQVRARIARE